MPYPQDIDQFTDKLNKKHDGSVYVIEEEVNPSNGIYEAMLNHDNINVKSVQVYTGPKLTGSKIDNFMLSVPAETHWKLLIKIFSSEPKLYVSYETPGDTVEAEDVNVLQDSVTATQQELDRYKAVTDSRTTEHGNRITSVENNKADKTYTDSELLKKADKVNTYTKTETDQRIKNVIGAAPESLDTLQELADALNNDPNFAANIINQLSTKVDKMIGKQLSTEDYTTTEKAKLAGIESGANKYVHPATHPPSIITQDANNRFVTDVEKTNWNAKETTTGAQNKVNAHANRTDNPHSVTSRQVNTLTLNSMDNDALLDSYPEGISVMRTTLDGSGFPHRYGLLTTHRAGTGGTNGNYGWQEFSKVGAGGYLYKRGWDTNQSKWGNWEELETTAGAQAKANSAEANAKNHANAELAKKVNAISTGSASDPDTTQESYILTNHENSPLAGYWHILTFFYLSRTGNRAQIALTYSGNSPRFMIRRCYSSTWTPWVELENVTGAQSKVDTHANRKDNPHAVTKAQVGLGDVDNVQQATKTEFTTHDTDTTRHITAAERSAWNSKQNALGFTPENVANKGKANGYAGLDASGKIPLAQVPNGVVTQDELGSAGYGDMLKSVYDKNNDGIVDRAKTADGVAWTGVTGKPSAMPADGGNSATVGGRSATSFAYSERKDASGTDLNTIIQSGMYRLGGNLLNAPAGVTYGQLIVSRGGGDTIAQIVTDYASNNIYWRSGNPTEVGGTGAWRAWRKIWHDGNDGSGSGLDADMLDGKHASEFMKKGPVTWKELKGV